MNNKSRNKNLYLAIGQFALAISILLNRFIGDGVLISFIIGLLTGLSIVFNLAFIIGFHKEKST
jgi:hypothetical protein